MRQKNNKTKFMNDMISHWQNGASEHSLVERIGNFAESSVPAVKEFGYTRASRSADFNELVDRRWLQVYWGLCKDFENIIYETLKRKFERGLASGRMTMFDIYQQIDSHGGMLEAKNRLYDLADIWQLQEETKALAKEKTALAYFVNDSQNVHTSIISQQTNERMDELSKVNITKKQQTLDEILTSWNKYPWAEVEPLYNDMKYWGNVREVIVPDDYAYRVALRALWAKIKTYEDETRDELVRRLFEECKDSVGMCAQGHLTRLANVLVGFDTTLEPIKESLQDKMAAISRLDITTALKIDEANKYMDEIKMPIEERSAWLEAF